MTFDPNATGNNELGLFSLPYSEEESSLVILPVPWEVTTSYGMGCSLGPQGILQASRQLDLCDALYGEFYQKGIFFKDQGHDILAQSKKLKEQALKIKEKLEQGLSLNSSDQEVQKDINKASDWLNQEVYQQAKEILDQKKFCAVVGGDHSSPYGLMKALKENHSNISVLQIDAHMDLRNSYQGYKHSHASIMNNVMNDLNPNSLVQMGIRDFCPEEKQKGDENKKIHTFYDSQVSLRLSRGESWESLCHEAIGHLSDEVYISFDIDGLSPDLCPQTGTPVPGGLSFSQMEVLLYLLSKSHKKVVGFDICEVSPGSNANQLEGWDTNVGARVLFKLCGCLLTNN